MDTLFAICPTYAVEDGQRIRPALMMPRLLPSGAVRDTSRSSFLLPQVGQTGVSEEPTSNSTFPAHFAQ